MVAGVKIKDSISSPPSKAGIWLSVTCRAEYDLARRVANTMGVYIPFAPPIWMALLSVERDVMAVAYEAAGA